MLWFRPAPAVPGPGGDVSGELRVHFIDVGQGDATLLQGPDFTILIDAGRHDRNDVVPYLRKAGVERIDVLIGTHPHADHIGQFPEVLAAFPVTEVWLSGFEHPTRTFERALDAIIASEARYLEPRAGEVYRVGQARLLVLNPEQLGDDLHDSNIVVHVQFGEIAFVFTGDAEAHTEMAIARRGYNMKADVLHLGHHGSATSTSDALLDAVRPAVAVYSAGADNSYGHPHKEPLARLAARGIPVYGTDRYGTIVIRTDGKDFSVSTEKEGSGGEAP